eukprot:gene34531-31168_t
MPAGCCGCLLRRAARDGESVQEARSKALLLPVLPALGLICTACYVNAGIDEVQAAWWGASHIDWDNAATVGATRVWALNVLLLDMLFVVDAREYASRAVLALTIAGLTMTSTEDLVRDRTSCATPPCALGGVEGVLIMVMALLVLLSDFCPGFAHAARDREEEIESSVATAEAIARALTRCAEIAAGTLSLGLVSALDELLINLQAYMPYNEKCF